MNNNKSITTIDRIDEIRSDLSVQIMSHSGLPESLNKERFIANSYEALKNIENIEKYKKESITQGLVKGAIMGLDFLNKECYLVPRGSELIFQTDYKGEKKIAQMYSIKKIKNIFANTVKKGDRFEYTERDGKKEYNYFPDPFSNGELIGAFAVVNYQDGTIDIEIMSAQEIEQVRRDYSSAPESKAWKKSPGEMYKKTVIRRLCKHIEIQFQNPKMMGIWEDESGFDFKEKKQKELFEGDITDVKFPNTDKCKYPGVSPLDIDDMNYLKMVVDFDKTPEPLRHACELRIAQLESKDVIDV